MKHRARAILVVVAVAAGCSGEPVLLRQAHKTRLINTIRQKLLESVEAEKSAVLSTSDEESQGLALESQRIATEIRLLRDELRPLIVADGRQDEIVKLAAVDSAWAEVERVDQRLLVLAVANTNLKAARLLAREGGAALDRFVDALTAMQNLTSEAATLRALGGASVAALREQSLLQIHIPSADDVEMSKLEQRMRGLSEEVERNLVSIRAASQPLPEQLAAASAAWDDFRRVAVDVLRLSRENTNVLSFEISVHEKRDATKECLSALSALFAAVESEAPATR